jgi:uncharacterized protein YecE (DUF72 family)
MTADATTTLMITIARIVRISAAEDKSSRADAAPCRHAGCSAASSRPAQADAFSFTRACPGEYLLHMILRIGTSGYSYKEWKGSFYPDDLKPADWLKYYGERLGTVEINNTFYRMPTQKLLEGWASQVPASFRFVLKVSQKITHYKRFKNVGEEAEYLVSTVATLGERLGALLVQIPPNFARDDERLSAFLDLIDGRRTALEVRHPSWLVPEVFALLEKHGVALVASQTDEEPEPRLVRTAPWGYLRLRKTAYAPGELEEWSRRIVAQGWDEAFVFFKHEQIAPDLAQKMIEAAGTGAGARAAKHTA